MVKIKDPGPVPDQGELGCSTAFSLSNHIAISKSKDELNEVFTQMYTYYTESDDIVWVNVDDIKHLETKIDNLNGGPRILQGVTEISKKYEDMFNSAEALTCVGRIKAIPSWSNLDGLAYTIKKHT